MLYAVYDIGLSHVFLHFSLLNPSLVTKLGVLVDIWILMDLQSLVIQSNKAYRRLKKIMSEK